MLLALLPCLLAASHAGLAAELHRLGVQTALVLPSSAIDDFPKWSPDSRYVAANVMGVWNKVDLVAITLVPGTLHEQKIGVVEKKEAITALDLSLVESWPPKEEPQSAAEAGGVRVEFKYNDLSTSLVVTHSGRAPRVVWTTGLEECGAPAVSPNGRFVAFLCVTNGLLVMTLQ